MSENETLAPANQPAVEELKTDNNTQTNQENTESVFSNEEALAIKRFLDNNGGFEKVKQTITARTNNQPAQEPTQPQQPTEPQQPIQPTQPQAPVQPVQPQMAQGYVSQQDLNVKRYFAELSRESNYAGIAKEIESGEVLDKINSFGIQISDNMGNINDAGIRRYLDLYSATKPAVQTSVAPTTIPTVDYVKVGDNMTYQEAMAVINQNSSLGTNEKHPATDKAMSVLAEHIKSQMQ